MGCFETTCALSGLTVNAGRKTRAGLIFLYAEINSFPVYRNSVGWMSMPMWGRCDDYGCVVVDDDLLTVEIIKNGLPKTFTDTMELQNKIQEEGAVIWDNRHLGYCIVREDAWKEMVYMVPVSPIELKHRKFIASYFSGSGGRSFDKFPDIYFSHKECDLVSPASSITVNYEFIERIRQSLAVHKVMNSLNMGWHGATNLGSQHKVKEMRATWLWKMSSIACENLLMQTNDPEELVSLNQTIEGLNIRIKELTPL